MEALRHILESAIDKAEPGMTIKVVIKNKPNRKKKKKKKRHLKPT